MTWRDVLKVHPAADIFPIMSRDELTALATDIEANGLMHKVVLTHAESPDGTTDWNAYQVLDGRNRLDAMEYLGWKLFDAKGRPVKALCTLGASDYCADDFACVASANIYRRHLTGEQRREIIAKLLKADPSRSDRRIAEMVKVSPTTVGTVRSAMETAGDVSKLDTRTDTKGRAQSARKQSVKKKQPSAYIMHADGRREPFTVTGPIALYTACGMPINEPAEIAQALAEFKLTVDICFAKIDDAARREAVEYVGTWGVP